MAPQGAAYSLQPHTSSNTGCNVLVQLSDELFAVQQTSTTNDMERARSQPCYETARTLALKPRCSDIYLSAASKQNTLGCLSMRPLKNYSFILPTVANKTTLSTHHCRTPSASTVSAALACARSRTTTVSCPHMWPTRQLHAVPDCT